MILQSHVKVSVSKSFFTLTHPECWHCSFLPHREFKRSPTRVWPSWAGTLQVAAQHPQVVDNNVSLAQLRPKACHLEGDPEQTVVQPEVQSPHPDVGQAAQASTALPDTSAPHAALEGPLCRGTAGQQLLGGGDGGGAPRVPAG